MTDLAETSAQKERLRRVLTRAILLVGFVAAVLVYFLAAPADENPLGYEPLDTKTYVHNLEVYGGKWNVLADEFGDWFATLWHGRRLAFTIATLTVLLVLAIRFFTAPDPPAAVAGGLAGHTGPRRLRPGEGARRP
jgi:hypothetical protein